MLTSPVQLALETDPAYKAVVWCYAPIDGECNAWHAPHVCEVCLTAADAHAYAKHLRASFHGHLFAVLPVGRTPLLARG